MSADCVILAAGLSSRMGQSKMTLEIGGRTIIERCVGAFSADCARLFVVTGRYHEEVGRCLASCSGVEMVHNTDYRQGMFRSVKEGVLHVTAERFFLTPGDHPFLQAETVRRMMQTPGCLVSPVYKGQPGHPVLLDASLIPGILHSTAPSLRDHLRGLSVERRELAVDDPGVVTDLDTAEEYRTALDEGHTFRSYPGQNCAE